MLTTLLVSVLSAGGRAQPVAPANGSTNTPAEEELCRIAQQMQAGIYERIINFGYIPSPERYEPTQRLTAHNEFTLLFLRFDGFEPVLDGTAYVGRVFMSERYLERDYNRKYTSRASYQTDNDGFFMACKLYFDERTLEHRLNIYPDYLLNICRSSKRPFKGMHFNQKDCRNAAQHWASLKYVVALNDKHYDKFSDENDLADVWAFLKNVPETANICTTHLESVSRVATDAGVDTDESDTPAITKLQENMIREINLRKQIKYFRVDLDRDAANIAASLTLRFTKYALSEDLLDNTTYTYTFVPDDSLIDAQLAERGRKGVFISRNPLYQSLLSSSEPDDNFIPGVALSAGITLEFGINDNLNSSVPDNKAQPQTTAVLKGNLVATNRIQQQQDSTQFNQLASKQQQRQRQLDDLQKKPQPANNDRQQTTDNVRQQVEQQKQQQQLQRIQQQQIMPNDLPNRIRISSVSTSDTSWVYAGRWRYNEMKVRRTVDTLKQKDTYRLPANQFLRDTIPILADANLWKKGNIKFGVANGVARKGDSFIVIDTRWRDLEPRGVYQYLWLKVTPKPKKD